MGSVPFPTTNPDRQWEEDACSGASAERRTTPMTGDFVLHYGGGEQFARAQGTR